MKLQQPEPTDELNYATPVAISPLTNLGFLLSGQRRDKVLFSPINRDAPLDKKECVGGRTLQKNMPTHRRVKTYKKK